jgi:hypothetical protein
VFRNAAAFAFSLVVIGGVAFKEFANGAAAFGAVRLLAIGAVASGLVILCFLEIVVFYFFHIAIVFGLLSGVEMDPRNKFSCRDRDAVAIGASEDLAAESLQTISSRLVRCVLNGSCDDKIKEAQNNAAFETEVNENGKGMTFSENELASNKTLVLPPDGYSNFDAMSGANLGCNATLQKSHSVSGLEYIRQRSAFGLSANEKFAHVFVVTPDRFDKDWSYFQNFSWTGDEATTYRKRRKVAAVAPKAAPQISQVDKEMALESMLQFVLTLEIEDKPTKEDMSI